jgi:hypothetical protein
MLWALPYTLLGMLIGGMGCLTGGKVQRRGMALEFYGGATNIFLRYVCGTWVSAITFGHTILGRDAETLQACRDHEWVHVRQYQRWGPFFGPAYLLSSLMVWCQGKRAYRDNHFEREAYGEDR